MVRVFLDANVLFSAAYRPDAGVTELWKIKKITLYVSSYVVDEARRNLYGKTQLMRLENLLQDIHYVDRWGYVLLPSTIELAEKDRPVLQAAIAAKASFLATGDKRDFGRYFGKKIKGVEIIRPAELLRKIH